jgi:hypothetical protein
VGDGEFGDLVSKTSGDSLEEEEGMSEYVEVTVVLPRGRTVTAGIQK